MNQDNRNLVLAIVCSALLVIGYQIFYELPKQQALEEQALLEQKDLILTAPEQTSNNEKIAETSIQQTEIVNAPRITIDTPSIEGSISLAGARIDDIVLNMMIKYNKHNTIVFNTSQMYRHDRLNYLKTLHDEALRNNFFIGIKLVRGAYIEKENKRAKRNNYLSPICRSKELTDQNFNNGASYILSNLNKFSLFSGTHNEESIYKIINIMEVNKINKDD